MPELTARGYTKAFVATDPDLLKFKVTDKVTALLGAAKFPYADACRPGNPRDTSVEEIAALYRGLM